MILHELSFNINFYETHLGQVKRAFGRQVSLEFIVNLQWTKTFCDLLEHSDLQLDKFSISFLHVPSRVSCTDILFGHFTMDTTFVMRYISVPWKKCKCVTAQN